MKAVACENTKLEVVDLPTPEPGQGPGARQRPALRDLRIRPPRPPPRRPAGRRAGGGRLRRLHALRSAGRASATSSAARSPTTGRRAGRRSRRARPSWRCRSAGVETTCTRSGSPPRRPAPTPSRSSSRSRSCSRSRTASPPSVGVLTEPMAIGWHAVRRSEIKKRDVAIVIGCGPVGLAVICMLKAQGVRTIVASDFSRGRRELATACGADVVVDPAEDSPYDAPGDRGHLKTVPAAVELAVGTMEKLRRLPVPWHHVWRVGRDARREAEAPRDLRVRRRAGHHRRHHRERAAVLPRRRGRGLHGARQDPPGDGDQQGDRPALRRRLHAARVPRHPPHARRGQGECGADGHRAPSACPASRAPSTHSATPRPTRRS